MKKLKILMTTMGMGLGGAETHIYELSKELVAKGHKVTVCSNGGEYVEGLERGGVSHVSAPLHERRIGSMLRSFFTLRKTIKALRPDIVHGHARIPSFLSSILCRLYRVPFVTTAHFNFKTEGALRLLSRWGRKALAVSGDLKKYLIESYGLSPSDVRVTVNGINTETFSPGASDGGLREELGIPSDSRVILNVSRMDRNACEATFRLLDCAARINAAFPDVRIVIVGSGECGAEIREISDRANRECGHPFISYVGGRSDIYRFCAMADLFVGVSRAALEAMSCSKPTILAGNQGYLGLFTEENLSDCVATNFTCRGFEYGDDDRLFREICDTLNLNGAALSEIGTFSRETILAGYSVGRMAGDAELTYNSALKKKPYDFLICGYYGYENTGDETLLATVLSNLRRRDESLDFAVLVRSTGDPSKYGDVRVIERFNPLAVLGAIRKSRAVIFGGGNLIQDATSTKSAVYYLSLLKVAQIFGVRTMLYANGVGPLTKKLSRAYASSVLKKVDLMTLREDISRELLLELGVPECIIEVTADETFTMLAETDLSGSAAPEGDYIAVSIRKYGGLDRDYLTKLSSAISEICEKSGLKAVFVPMQSPQDDGISKEISALVPGSCTVSPSGHIELLAAIGKSRLLIGMRLHSLVFAAGLSVPAVGLVYDPKVEGFLNYIGLNSHVDCGDIDVNRLVSLSLEMLCDRDRTVWKLRESVAVLTEKAKRNAELAVDLLERNSGSAM